MFLQASQEQLRVVLIDVQPLHDRLHQLALVFLFLFAFRRLSSCSCCASAEEIVAPLDTRCILHEKRLCLRDQLAIVPFQRSQERAKRAASVHTPFSTDALHTQERQRTAQTADQACSLRLRLEREPYMREAIDRSMGNPI